MPIATHTLTGDLLPVLGGVEWDSVTAWLECEPFADFVQDPGTGTLMPDRRLPFDVAADGSFSVVVPDSAQAGLSYRLNAQPSLAGRRLAGKRSDPFTVASSGRWDEMPFTPPDIPEAVRLAALTDAAVAALLADPGSLTFAAGGRGRWPVVQIDTGGVAVDSKETYVPGTYTITDTDGGVVHSGALNIKGRGNTTWNQPKKPYRLQLASKTALLGMSASQKNWALLANYLDHAKVNTHLAYTLGARLSGLTWTPQYRVVEVVLNGDYLGLYQLCDLVRMESGRLDEDPPDADTGSGLTGTYLLEADNKEQPGYPGESDDPGWATSHGQWIIYDDPAEDDLTAAQIAYIQGYIDDFETALYGTGFADPDTGWRAWADEASFVDWYIVQELFANSDSALWSSCKMWKARDGKLHMGPLWDFDLSLGEPEGWYTDPTAWVTRAAGWYTRLFADDTFADAVAARWPQVLEALGDYEQAIDRLIDAETLAIGRDDKRWTRTTYTPLQADKRKRWLAARIAWLGAQLTTPTDPGGIYSDTYADTY